MVLHLRFHYAFSYDRLYPLDIQRLGNMCIHACFQAFFFVFPGCNFLRCKKFLHNSSKYSGTFPEDIFIHIELWVVMGNIGAFFRV